LRARALVVIASRHLYLYHSSSRTFSRIGETCKTSGQLF